MHVAGKRPKEIAAALGYSPHRVSTIISSPLFQERKAALLDELRETTLGDLLEQIRSEAIPNLAFLISIRDDPRRHLRERLRAARVISAELDRVYPRKARGAKAGDGPVRIGTAFVDRGRCLPWATGRPCIVCEEVCPVSPKAITTRTVLEPVAGLDRLMVTRVGSRAIHLNLPPTRRPLAGGDYFLVGPAGLNNALRIAGHQTDRIEVVGDPAMAALRQEASAAVHVRLQQPFVDPHRCIGCGVCQHECPVRGRAAIRVTSENETRSRAHALLAGAGLTQTKE